MKDGGGGLKRPNCRQAPLATLLLSLRPPPLLPRKAMLGVARHAESTVGRLLASLYLAVVAVAVVVVAGVVVVVIGYVVNVIAVAVVKCPLPPAPRIIGMAPSTTTHARRTRARRRSTTSIATALNRSNSVSAAVPEQ